MKTIGILGGTSWPSTFDYYSLLNTMTAELLGGFHSAKIVVYSLDYHPIKSLYNDPEGWDAIPLLFKEELEKVASLPIDCLIIANNTLHKALDYLKERDIIPFHKPIFHGLQLTADKALSQKAKSVLLLGTRYTMQDNFFKKYFIEREIEVLTPSPEDQDHIQTMQTHIASGGNAHIHTNALESIVASYSHQTDCIILGCTELPAILKHTTLDIPLLNPIYLQCKAAFDFAHA
jgi:aspartate racemase